MKTKATFGRMYNIRHSRNGHVSPVGGSLIAA